MPSAIRDLISVSSAASSASQEDTVGSVFFLEKDLFPGSKMTLHFTCPAAAPTPSRSHPKCSRRSSPSSPCTRSPAADAMRSSLAECEAAPLAGEAKHCATSIESMVEFAASTEVDRAEPAPRQAYKVEAVKPMPVFGGDMVACHGMAYAYAVFGCHNTTVAAYTVILAGADGTKAEALAACHVDAAPGVAEEYKRLGVKPGSVPVCHFLPQDNMLWVRN
uniref:BURP domain-containing protein n=1 Tax=Oryza punctata TaxID=4537 RepID=A0A0E0KZU7_ORYPU